MNRLRAYWRFASALGAYPLLAIVWALQLWVVARNIGARLGHLAPAGMHVADLPCFYPQCDFSAFWLVGVLGRLGDVAAAYDPAVYGPVWHRLFLAHAVPLAWYYPPPALLLVAPASLLPFEPGFYVWVVVLGVAAAWLLRRAGLPWVVVAAVVFCPAALWDWQLGQLGALMGALLVGGLLAAGRAPGWAGLALGLLVMKPQAGFFLAPAAMLGGRHWRVIAVAAGVVALLLAATTAAFGFGVWRDFLDAGLAGANAVLLDPDLSGSQKFGISVFWMARAGGAAAGPAMAAQLAAAGMAMAAGYWAWRGARLDAFERLAVTAGLALLVTPYGYTEDMVGFSAGLAALAWRRGWRIDLLDALFWSWPTLSPLVFMRTGWLMTPLVVAVAAGRIWWRARGAVLPAGAAVLPGG